MLSPLYNWDISDLGLFGEPLDTVLSDDIWKKFDLDAPLAVYNEHYDRMYEESNICFEQYGKKSCHDYHEIRHHDCMWAGLCVSEEHSRSMPVKRDDQLQRRIPPGRSLLISKTTTTPTPTPTGATTSIINNNIYNEQQRLNKTHLQQSLYCQQTRRTDSLESDGDSTRPETPQTSTESDSDNSDCDHPIFKHDQICINDKLSECMTVISNAAPVSEVTGQLVRSNLRIKTEIKNNVKLEFNDEDEDEEDDDIGYHNKYSNYNNNYKIKNNNINNNNNNKSFVGTNFSKVNDIRTTLDDHCYHINQPCLKRLNPDQLGVQTPSDSEEEIDVVSFEKPIRPPTALPTHPNLVDHKTFANTVNTVLKVKPPPRPRGRPPNSTRKQRSVQPSKQHQNNNHQQQTKQHSKTAETKSTKRAATHQRPTQKKTKMIKVIPPMSIPVSIPMISPIKSTINNSSNISSSNNSNSSNSSIQSKTLNSPTKTSSGLSSRSSSDEEMDLDKRNLHNNMERQRRIDLRNAFDDLRKLVPEIENNEKSAKVAILRQAAKYCDRLKEIEAENILKINELRRKQDKYIVRVKFLRKSLALTR